jgi:sec-independent protein translocase protein TatA
MPFGIGIWELLILLLVLLLVFGPKRLPEMGRQLGKGMREFKESVTGDSKDDEVVALPPAEPVVPVESPVPAAPAASKSREQDTLS